VGIVQPQLDAVDRLLGAGEGDPDDRTLSHISVLSAM
jgi:hypothetical protein